MCGWAPVSSVPPVTSQEPQAADPSPAPLPPVPPPSPSDRRAVRRALRRADGERSRLKGELLVALVVGSLISAATIAVQAKLDGDAAARAEDLAERAEVAAQRRDDLRFVREVASAPGAAARPFDGLDLTEANISGLPLGCDMPPAPDCASFVRTTLKQASLVGADLRGARFQVSNAASASFARADLRRAYFDTSDLASTDFEQADLRGAIFGDSFVYDDGEEPSFRHADLRGTRFVVETSVDVDGVVGFGDLILATPLGELGFDGSCWDETTVWPAGFEPPPSNPEACRPE